MRKLVMLSAAAMLAFGVTGTASAAPLDCDGTLMLELGTLPQIPATGGGVATVNDSGGLGHLGDLRLKASRGGIRHHTGTPWRRSRTRVRSRSCRSG